MEQFGKYNLIKKIAIGGMANIYLAEYSTIEGFKKKLVLKRILPKYSSDKMFTSMFINEANIAVNLNHRNIVQTFDFGKVKNEYFISMEHIDGFDLINLFRIYMHDKSKIDIEIVLFILMEILKGLNYIHERKENDIQLIHRDISLSNVIISKTGEVKILDFGVAKSSIDDKISGEDLKGKRSYMAPEQLRQEDLDGRIDIYALGMVAWRLLTGEKPFNLNDIKTKDDLLNVKIANVSSINTNISYELSSIIMKAIEKDRDKRYNNAMEFYQAIYNYVVKKNKMINHFNFIKFIEKNANSLIIKKEYQMESNTQKQKNYSLSAFNEANLNKKRNVLLIYCDIKGVYELHEEYSIEEIKHLMKIFFKLVSNIAYKYKVPIVSLEDEVMIFAFGATIAKENDIIESFKFSKEIQETFYSFIKDYKTNMNISIIINRGRVIVTELSDDMKIKILYSKDFLKITRRKAEQKEKGIFLDNSIENIAKNFFKLESQNELLKILRVRNEKKINKKFVLIARKKEIHFLENSLNKSIKNKKSAFNFLIGDKGIGKTKISKELINYLKNNYRNFYLLKGRALESDSNFGVFKDALKYFLKIKTRQGFEEKMNFYLKSLEANKKREMIALIGDFLDIDYSKDPYIQSLNGSIKYDLQLTKVITFLKMISKQKHVILFLENINLVSDSSLIFINKIITQLNIPLFLLATSDYSILTRKIKINQKIALINLKPLNKIESGVLIKDVLKQEVNTDSIDKFFIPTELIDVIYTKSSGNPLFIKEIIKLFIQKNIISIEEKGAILKKEKLEVMDIPISLEIILQSDFDNLKDNEKIVLQRAAIFGDKFWLSPMTKLLGSSVIKTIEVLEIKGLIYKRSVENSVLKTEYIFKHSLLQKMIYDSMILKLKKSIHLQVANILISYNEDSLNKQIAIHFSRAEEYEMSSKYYLEAGDKYLNAFSISNAVDCYRNYINSFNYIKNKNWKKYINIKLKLASLSKELGKYEEAFQLLKEVNTQLNQKKIKDLYYLFNLNMADFYFLIKDYEKALYYINLAKKYSKTTKDMLEVLNLEAWILYKQNFLDKANKKLEEIIEISLDPQNDIIGGSSIIMKSYSLNSLILLKLGIYQKAAKYEKKVLSYYKDIKNWKNVFISLNHLGNIYVEGNEYDNAKLFYDRAARLIKEKPIMDYLKVLLNNSVAKLFIKKNNYKGAIRLLQDSVKLLEDIKINSFHYETHKILAEIYIDTKQNEKALEEIKIADIYASDEEKDLLMVYKIIGNKKNTNKDPQIEQLLLKILSSDNSKNKALIHSKIIKFYETINPKKAKIYKENLYKKEISILYVEDETGIRKSLSRFLGRLASKLFIAEDGLEGLNLYEKHRPDIVISDIRMPNLNGIEMVSEIKKINSEQHVIFTTAFGDDKHLADAINMQVDGYILKPVNLTLLKSKVESIIKLLEYEDISRQKNNIINQIDEKYKKEAFLILDLNRDIISLNKIFFDTFKIKNNGNSEIVKYSKGIIPSGLENWINSIKFMEVAGGFISMLNINNQKTIFKINIVQFNSNYIMIFKKNDL